MKVKVMDRKLSTGMLLLSTLSVALMLPTESASAFSWDQDNDIITIHNGDAKGQYFDIFFWDAFSGDKLLEGLEAEARFTLEDDFDASSGSAKFKVDVTNNSDGTIWDSASVTGLGFAVDPDVAGATSDGVFDNAYVGAQKTGLDQVELCYSNGHSCTSGGQNGGVKLGDTASFYTTLNFGSGVTDSFSFFLDGFYANFKGDSDGLGYSADAAGEVPTPALIPGLIGAGIAALRRKQKGQDDEGVQQSA
ncbi:MAG: cistern family PEP-CTERM protein [Cyanobacteria bacterium J06626_18]